MIGRLMTLRMNIENVGASSARPREVNDLPYKLIKGNEKC